MVAIVVVGSNVCCVVVVCCVVFDGIVGVGGWRGDGVDGVVIRITCVRVVLAIVLLYVV